MAKRTFYVALGVPRGADPEAVHVAYRKVVSRYREQLEHRQEAVEGSAAPGEEGCFAVTRTYSERRHAGQFDEPEPLVPEQRGDTDVDRYFGGFVPEVAERRPRARPAGRGKDLFVELQLMTHEARRGGLFPVHVPVVRSCPACGELEQRLQKGCKACDGTGRVTEDRTIDVAAPPGVEHGDEARIPMEDVGLESTDLVIKVFVTKVKVD